MVFFFGLSCKNSSEKQINSDNKSKNESKVLIQGIIKDTNVQRVTLNSDSFFFGKPFVSGNVAKDSFNIVFSLEQPQIFSLYSVGGNFFMQNVLVSPSDSVFMVVKNAKPHFSGKNEAHYNFYFKLAELNLEWPIYNYGDLIKFKKDSEIVYGKKNQFFENFLQSNPQVSTQFVDFIRSELRYEYLHNLMKPRVGIEGYNSTESIFEIAKSYSERQEPKSIPSSYFGNLNIEEFNNEKYIKNPYFKIILIPLIRFYFMNSNQTLYTKENFELEKKFIKENFNGAIEHYATSRLIYDYYKKVFPDNMNNIENIKSTIVEYLPQINNPSYIEEIQRVRLNLNNYYTELPYEVLNEDMEELDENTVALKNIIKGRKNNSIKIIDFWASWCLPCIKEIKNGKDFRKKLAEEFDVEWIYISVDTDKQKWINMSYKLESYGLSANQFRIYDAKNSKIEEFFNLRDIPRYAIFDKDGKLVLDNAPKPSETKVFQKIVASLNKEL